MKQLIAFLTFFALSSLTKAQHLNFEAIDQYFALTDSLRQNMPLSDKAWNELIAHKGIQLYIQNNALNEQTLKSYKRNLEIAYMPKNDSILKVRLQQPEKYFLAWVFNNYKTQEAELKNYYQKLKANQSAYLDSIYANCYALLPDKMQKKANNTTIYFIPIMNDAVAEGNDLVFTLYGAYHFDQLKFGALGGHEIHHILRGNKEIHQENDKHLYQALTLLLHEGSADLIDKKYTAQKKCPEDLAYFEYMFQNGQNYVAALDTAILAHIDKSKTITAQDLPNIVPMSGHIPGCYMATIIDRNGYRNKLVKNIDNPVRFILLYNEAAKKDQDKPHVFSKKTISYLKRLEP